MKSSLLLLAVALVQRILALDAVDDEHVRGATASELAPGGGEGGEGGAAGASGDTPANAAAPSGGVM